jgi:Holliday junction resolvase RusA-like endonuclease
MTVVEILVLGLPAPQGSKTPRTTPTGKTYVREGSSASGRVKHKAWRAAVRDEAATLTAAVGMIRGPVKVTVEFRFPMPPSRPAALRAAGVCWHAVKPDKDKLLRSTFDALVDGGLIEDDGRICSFEVVATEHMDSWYGARITVATAPEIGRG